MNDKITIKLLRMGVRIKNIKILQDSTVKDLKAIIGATGNTSCFQEIKGKMQKLNSDYILRDNDVLALVSAKTGEALIKCGGRKWAIHLNDKDNWPSNFHAHDYEKKEKLDLFTGRVYNIQNKKNIKNMTAKKHKAILVELAKYKCFKEKAEDVLMRLY